MMMEYFKIVKEIKELQNELLEINKELQFTKDCIQKFQKKKEELENKIKKYDSHIKTLSLIGKNKYKIDPRIIENSKSDINLLYSKKNNTSAEIFNCKVKIGQQEKEYQELEKQTLPIKKELKDKYFRRDLFLNAILTLEMNDTPQDGNNITKNR